MGLSYSVVQGVTFDLAGGDYTDADITVTLAFLTVTGSWLRGEPPHHVEIGGGFSPGYTELELPDTTERENDLVFGVSGILGYRYQRPEGGPFLRIAYTPLWVGDALAPLWGSVSIGWTF